MFPIANLVRTFALPEGVASYSDLRVRVRTEDNNNPVRIYDKNNRLLDPNGLTALSPQGQVNVWVLRGFDYILDLVSATDLTFIYDTRRNMAADQPNDDPISKPRSVTVSPPIPYERIVLFNTQVPVKLASVIAVLPGAYDTPSLEFNIGFGANVAQLGTTVWTSDIVLTNTTTGIVVSDFDVALIPENVWVWLAINNIQGTIPSLQVTMKE